MKSELTAALKNVLAALDFPDTSNVNQQPKNSEHGDFSSNLAMLLAPILGDNPHDIAQSIANKLEIDFPQLVAAATIAGPGFINIHIQKDQIISQQEYHPGLALSPI